jgi:rubrerythrin
MKVVPGYLVEVLETIRDAKGEIAEELATYGNSFLQKDRKEAVKDYSFCVWQVHYQWRAIGESRVKTLRESGQEGGWYECPLCGYMGTEFFETCRGCGKRFMRLGND